MPPASLHPHQESPRVPGVPRPSPRPGLWRLYTGFEFPGAGKCQLGSWIRIEGHTPGTWFPAQLCPGHRGSLWGQYFPGGVWGVMGTPPQQNHNTLTHTHVSHRRVLTTIRSQHTHSCLHTHTHCLSRTHDHTLTNTHTYITSHIQIHAPLPILSC